MLQAELLQERPLVRSQGMLVKEQLLVPLLVVYAAEGLRKQKKANSNKRMNKLLLHKKKK